MNARFRIGAVLMIIGVLLPLGAWFPAKGDLPGLPFKEQVRSFQVVFHDEMIETFSTIGWFRRTFPMYKDMSDAEVARRLNAKFFSETKAEEFGPAFLREGAGHKPEAHPAGTTLPDPMRIRPESEYGDMDPIKTAMNYSMAIDLGLVKLERDSFIIPYVYFVAVGITLFAIGLASAIVNRKKSA